MHDLDSTRIAAVDLGKTHCRLRIGTSLTEGAGASGLAERSGATRAVEAVLAALARQPADLRESVRTLSVGAAGVLSAPEAARRVARELSEATGAPVAITSDVVTAHAGALDGDPGTVLVAGTGAVACGIDRRGSMQRADGVGIWLGDEGSGRWIGQRGLSAVLKSADGRGPFTVLTAAAIDRLGPLNDLPARIGGAAAPERALASFAPAVLDAADAGDEVATAIRDAAAAALATTALAAAPPGDQRVAVLGGLAGNPGFASVLAAALSARGLEPVSPKGDALDGAVLIGARTRLPHETQVIRIPGAPAPRLGSGSDYLLVPIETEPWSWRWKIR